MKTKIVYVLTSTGNDIFIEQAYMSIWSCKYYNPGAEVYIVADEDSLHHIENYPALCESVSDIITLPFDDSVSKADRSRSLKTSLRKLIKGNFLYVDGDTIFCDSLDELDNIDYEIGMVENVHAVSVYKSHFGDITATRSILIFNVLPPLNAKFYNGGVIYAKDSEIVYNFFDEWHNNWLYSNKKTGLLYDQPALFQTFLKFKDYIKSLDGIYNAQIVRTDKYLKNGKILHLFHIPTINCHPFLNKEYYNEIKDSKQLSEKIKSDILNCKNLYDHSFFNRKYKFMPKFLIKHARKIRRYYTYNILGYFRYKRYKKFYNEYNRAKRLASII